ncbi:hypothetical protein KDW_00180 [Dictyobacter vulcani]|uniref:Uncharacterized protein n=1 Tax=Dictyobacter vulcani TaxID=2607529 RepID=A0A5J4KKZ9_9CHLR|nr:hypothetical protein KDW_00180 [Dictyobacter vulcani]
MSTTNRRASRRNTTNIINSPRPMAITKAINPNPAKTPPNNNTPGITQHIGRTSVPQYKENLFKYCRRSIPIMPPLLPRFNIDNTT